MRSVLVLLLSFFLLNVCAQQKYDAGTIPRELLPYASSVIRNQEVTINIKDPENYSYHVKEAITILNKNGDDDAGIVLWHNKSNTIKTVKGIVYNSFGIPVAKFSESDFEDVSTQDGFSLFDDSKVKHYKPSVTDYPYTVEYEYETRSKQTLDLDSWEPNPGTGIAVEKGLFTIVCNPNFNIRYKEINMPVKVTISLGTDNSKVYTWQVSNLKAIKSEPYSPNANEYLSEVKLAPEKFSFGGMSGSYTDWNSLGKWISDNLLINRQSIDPATTAQIQSMTNGITDPKLKAKKIYEYMQNKTHYINVIVGIGGVQPIPASDVDKQNYGDCKALVNYTKALLEAVNIESYYCIVMADHSRKISLLRDFASMDQANHIILCIPFKNDTTWCDCTSQTIPFGYLGDFTDDRTVLACTPQGGKLLHTPRYTAEDNLEQRKSNFVLNAEGELSGDMCTIFRGTEYDDREGIIHESLKEQLKDIQHVYPINNMDVQKITYNQDKSLKPVTTETVQLKAPEYASVTDNKINFLLNTVNRMQRAPREVMNRRTDVYINEGYTDEDEVTYSLPIGYKSETLPLNITINRPFGKFTVTSTLKDGKLVYKRKLQLIDGTYPKDSYQDLVDFFQSVVDADESSITLVKNN